MINKDFANSFAEKMKDAADKENKHKDRLIELLETIVENQKLLLERIKIIESKIKYM